MMRYRNLILVLLFVLCGQSVVVQAYTEIYGHVSGTLSLEDSPFLIIDTIIIPQEDELVIEPGVEVYVMDVNQQLYFWIYGNLIADGTPDSLISFKAFQPDTPEDITWNGLFISCHTLKNRIQWISSFRTHQFRMRVLPFAHQVAKVT